jgi:ubiquinone/menaquinone biosynthesis C-methylase UbiE
MTTASTMKRAFRARWNLSKHVTKWIGSGLNADFQNPSCRRAWRNALKQAASGAGTRSALDLGTGPGTLAQLWAELGYHTTGVDFSPGMVAMAKEQAAKRCLDITFLEGDAESPPFTRQRFDVISSRFVLFTLPHPGYAVRRWTELLNPGGVIVLSGHIKRGGDGHQLAHPHPHPHPHPPQSEKHPVLASETLEQERIQRLESRHKAAQKHLPYMHHDIDDLQVLLEAVGLVDIRRVSMTKVIAARTAMAGAEAGSFTFTRPPFLIVGRKSKS